MPITTNVPASDIIAEVLGEIVWVVLKWVLYFALYSIVIVPTLDLPPLKIFEFFAVVILIRFILETHKKVQE